MDVIETGRLTLTLVAPSVVLYVCGSVVLFRFIQVLLVLYGRWVDDSYAETTN